MRIIRKGTQREPERLYTVMDVSMATGLTENAIYAYFSNKGVSVRGGITLDQVEEILLARDGKTRRGVIWEKVREIRQRLRDEKGIEILMEDEDADVHETPAQPDMGEQMRIC